MIFEEKVGFACIKNVLKRTMCLNKKGKEFRITQTLPPSIHICVPNS